MDILQVLAPIVGPLVVALLNRFVPNIPSVLKPILATVTGALAAYFGGADPHTAAALGASGVAIRETLDQTKKAVS